VNVGHNKELQLRPCLTVRLRKLCLENSTMNVSVVVAQKEESLLSYHFHGILEHSTCYFHGSSGLP
jgi:hypothetical protein